MAAALFTCAQKWRHTTCHLCEEAQEEAQVGHWRLPRLFHPGWSPWVVSSVSDAGDTGSVFTGLWNEAVSRQPLPSSAPPCDLRQVSLLRAPLRFGEVGQQDAHLCAALKTSRYSTGGLPEHQAPGEWVNEWRALSSGFVLGALGTSGHLPLAPVCCSLCERRCH